MFDQVSTFAYLIAIVFFVLLGYRPPWWNRKSVECRKREVQDIPGPLALPVIGTQWVFSFGGYSFGKLHEFYEEMNRKYGGIFKQEALFNVPVISIFDKQDIEKVLKSSGKYPIRPPSEAVSYYRKSRPERYASIGLVNEQGKLE